MDIDTLVAQIESVDFHEFWYGSRLLAEAAKYKEHDLTEEKHRVTKALAMRHHFLENKSAGSCIVLRHTIKEIQGIYMITLWEMVGSDDENEAYAAIFILGEVGGVGVLQKIINILRKVTSQHGINLRLKPKVMYPRLINCLLHTVIRYFQVLNQDEPTAEIMDVKSGEIKTVPLKEHFPDKYDRAMRDSESMNEFFKHFTTEERLDELTALLQKIPKDHLLDVARDKLPKLIEGINRLKMVMRTRVSP